MTSRRSSRKKGKGGPSDAELMRAILEQGFALQKELDAGLAVQERLSRKDEYKPLLTILVEQRALTPNQAKRITQTVAERGKLKAPTGFEIIEPLGTGSMGAVFKARQISMDRVVALKMLKRQLAMNQEFIERFLREARVAAKLSHANVVQAIDSGESSGSYYFVMEFVDGTNIKQELDEGKVYQEEEALKIALQIARALEHAHTKSLIHRDVKPENIMLTGEGVAKLADLGLARLEEDDTLALAEKGLAVGTPYYISPEQIRGEVDLDIRCDIYAFGATLYHMVTGRVPFSGRSPTEVMQKHLRASYTPPDHINRRLSGGFGEVIETMMAKDRQSRYSTPKDLIMDLESLSAGEAPVLAGASFGASTMESLADGEDFEGAGPNPLQSERLLDQLKLWKTIGIILGLALLLSLLGNFIQMQR